MDLATKMKFCGFNLHIGKYVFSALFTIYDFFFTIREEIKKLSGHRFINPVFCCLSISFQPSFQQGHISRVVSLS